MKILLLIGTIIFIFITHQVHANNSVLFHLCVIKNNPPFYSVENGAEAGIMADFSHLISHKLSRSFNIIATNDTLTSLEMMDSGQCDGMFSLVKVQQSDFIYSKTISYYPLGIAVLSNTSGAMGEYKGMRLAINMSHFNNKDFIADNLALSDMPIKTGLVAVSMGAIDGYIDVMPVIMDQLKNYPKPNIKVIELALKPLALKLLMRPNKQEFMTHVNARIDNISKKNIIDIDKKWLTLDYQLKASPWLIWLLIALALLILFIFKLKKNKHDLKKRLHRLVIDNENNIIALNQQKNIGLRFVETISHEYRTPIAIINTNVDILEQKNKYVDIKISGQISKIRDSVIRLISIIETTLDREKLSSENIIAKMNTFDFRQCLDAVLDDLSRVYHHRIVVIKCNDQVLPYTGDERLISLMLRNVIENTYKYSPITETVSIELQLNKKCLQITIRDNGIGVPSNDIEYIFEKYHRASNTTNSQGLGLGLYLTKTIVLQHQGNINVHCPNNAGTEVLIVLPIQKDENL